MTDQEADISWRDGSVPVSDRFDDPYYSLENGLDETRYVFLQGNRLPHRLRSGFAIAELGFGTGLNLLATVAFCEEAGFTDPVRFTSFEMYPVSVENMRRSLGNFPEMDKVATPLLAAWSTGTRQFSLKNIEVDVIIGDAREELPNWQGKADAWFLDGFSPAKNSELWGPELMDQVAAHTNKEGTVATYTAAGFVRQGLSEAGFEVERIKGYGRKRHMTVATLKRGRP